MKLRYDRSTEAGDQMEKNSERVLSTAEIVRRYRLGQRDFRGLDIQDLESEGPAFRDAVLDDADFGDAWIEADFSNAGLRRTTFRNANVKCCTFDGADLTNADFSNAAVDGATFVNSKLAGSNFKNAGAYGYSFSEGEYPR